MRQSVGHVLVRGGDLLGDDVERPVRCRRAVGGARCRRGGEAVLQPREILGRVVQAVGVVDAQAVDLAGGGQVEREALRRLEHARVFHAQAGELVDVEEAPVVDLVGGHPPEREPVGLRLVQRVQRRPWPARGVDRPRRRRADRGRDGRLLGGQRGQALLQQLLVASSLGRFGDAAGDVVRRQVRERRRPGCCSCDASRALRLRARAAAPRISRVAGGSSGKPVLVVAQGEAAVAGVPGQHQLVRRPARRRTASPSTGSSTLPSSSALTGCQSMSK